MSKSVVVASGYFDPMHYGHIEYLQKSKDLGDKLIVIVNSDKQARMKKGNSRTTLLILISLNFLKNKSDSRCFRSAVYER